MRTLAVNFEGNSITVVCGAPGHTVSAVFAANPVRPFLAKLAEMIDDYNPEKILLCGTNKASTAVEKWFDASDHVVIRFPAGATEDMADALASGATRLTFSGETADYGQRPSSEKTALAALELHHRLTTRPADQVRGRRVYK